jgi:peroxiredoxin Q/BCP
MAILNVGDQAPDFNLPSDDQEQSLSNKDFQGKRLVIFFYPKDNTPGCSQESCDFRDLNSVFQDLNTQIIGVSKDSLKAHEKFRDKKNLNFPLLSDENSTMCEDYGVWKEKSMFGRKYMGIERTTFLVDEKGIILKIWQKVKVAGHVDDVLETIKEL